MLRGKMSNFAAVINKNMNYIENMQRNISSKEGESVAEKMLHDVFFYGPISNKELSRRAMLPIPVVTALKKEGIKSGIFEQEHRCGMKMSTEGCRYLEDECGFSGIDRELYLQLLDKEEAREKLMAQLSKEHCFLFLERPKADVTIDQAQCTIQTAFRRAILCLCNGTLVGKRVLCLGDDDFVSVALGFLLKRMFPGKTEYKTDICVMDMDERLVRCIWHLTEKYRLPIRCEQIDIRKPLPVHLSGYFDCVFTDPPYTQEGASLFLSRAVSAMKPMRGLNIFFSFANKPVDETFALQQVIQMHGLSVREIYLQFNEYEGAALLGNRGQLLLLETTGRTRAIAPVGKSGRNDIYTADAHRRKSGASHAQSGLHILADFYECRSEELDNVPLIRQYMHEAAIKSGATIVEECFHQFAPEGVSGVVVIQESHFTIHTWPEHRYASIDLFTCGERTNPWAAFDYLTEKLRCDNVEYRDLSRGIRNTNS